VTRYSAVSGKTLIAALKGIGFEEIRVRGSHQRLSNIKIQRQGPKMPDKCTGLLSAVDLGRWLALTTRSRMRLSKGNCQQQLPFY
jgi:hypothetical protein